MKTWNTLGRWFYAGTLAAALFTAATSVSAQEKGAQKLTQLKPITKTADIEALQQGDAVVMSCPKCKSMTVAYVETTKGKKEEKLKQQHLCPGCESVIETKGHGKAKTDEVVHTCKKCGSKDVMCCVLKKGTIRTEPMQEK